MKNIGNKVKNSPKIALFFGAFFLLQNAFAIDLLGVYEKAKTNDPVFRGQAYQYLANKENVAIARSALLPSLMASGNIGGERYQHQNLNLKGFSLALNQTVIDFSAWGSLGVAKSEEKAAFANYGYAIQDLMVRATNAYLDVLNAADILKYTIAEKVSVKKELEQTQAKFRVGLATITELEQVKASYDNARAAEINAKNGLDVAKEELTEITGEKYDEFASVSYDSLPLVKPDPNDINQWVVFAQNQNLLLRASQYTLEAAKNSIYEVAGHMGPTIGASAEYDYSDSSISPHSNSAQYGVSFKIPLFAGGANVAKTREARALYNKAMADLEKTNRQVESDVRQAYLGVLSQIEYVKANRQAVISARASFNSTRASYDVGTSSMTDVLKQQSGLYNAERSCAESEYAYIKKTLQLKEAAGLLNQNDIVVINSWLSPNAIVPKAKMVVKATTPRALKKCPYVLQFIAGTNKGAISRFAEKEKIDNAVIYQVPTTKNYIGTLGCYSSYQKAKQAKKQSTYKNLWIRMIHNEKVEK